MATKTTSKKPAQMRAKTAVKAPKKAIAAATSQRRSRWARVWIAAARPFKPLRQNWALCLGTILLLAAAQLSLRWRPAVGVYVNAGVFAAFCGLALWREQFRKLAISLAILPVAMMITLSLPQANNFAEAVVFYDALLLLALVYRFWFTIDEPVQSTALAARGYGLTLPLMVVVGQALGGVGYLLLRMHYMYLPVSLPLVAAASVVFAIAEEMLFRGLIQQRAAKVMHPALAAVLSAVAYALFTIDHSTSLGPLFGLLMGAVLSFIYFKKQNLLLTITVNAMSKLAYIALLATFVLR